MTTEQLMKPRYKVIADYPNSPYKVGDIIVMPDDDRSFHLVTIQYTDEFGENVNQQEYHPQSTILKYPHLFRKLEWWEDRELSEMPEYVKEARGPEVYKFESLSDNMIWFYSVNGTHAARLKECLLPATLSDYTAYINQTKQTI